MFDKSYLEIGGENLSKVFVVRWCPPMITEWSPYQAILNKITFHSDNTFLTTTRARAQKKTKIELCEFKELVIVMLNHFFLFFLQITLIEWCNILGKLKTNHRNVGVITLLDSPLILFFQAGQQFVG